jgi:hypothetical protein
MVESPLDGTFGDFWTGPDGAIHATRLVGDAAGTVELVRFDLSPIGQVTATATASWTGTGLLTGWPTTMGPSTVFMVGTQPLVFDTPDATPVLYPALGITWTSCRRLLPRSGSPPGPARPATWSAGRAPGPANCARLRPRPTTNSSQSPTTTS